MKIIIQKWFSIVCYTAYTVKLPRKYHFPCERFSNSQLLSWYDKKQSLEKSCACTPLEKAVEPHYLWLWPTTIQKYYDGIWCRAARIWGTNIIHKFKNMFVWFSMKTWFQKYDSSLLVGKLGKRQNITEWILSVKGGGYPQIPLRKKTFFLGPKTLFFAFFYALLALFGPLYGLFGPFLTLFNEKNIIFSPFRKKFPGKA